MFKKGRNIQGSQSVTEIGNVKQAEIMRDRFSLAILPAESKDRSEADLLLDAAAAMS